MGTTSLQNRHERAALDTFFRHALESNGCLIAIDVKSQQLIGSSRFHGSDDERIEVEIGWTFLARSHWGGRYNGEMKRLMLRHAFQFVNRVVCLAGRENPRSQRAVEKIGAVRGGTRPYAGGNDSFVYQITASAFESK